MTAGGYSMCNDSPQLYQASCDVLCDHINTLWKLVLEQRNKRKLFSEALRSFLPFAFHPLLFVTHSSTNEQLHAVLEQVMSTYLTIKYL